MMQMLTKPEIFARYQIGNSGLYDRIREGTFPPAIKLSARRCFWLAHEADAILMAHVAGKTKEEIRKLVTELVEQRKAGADRVAA